MVVLQALQGNDRPLTPKFRDLKENDRVSKDTLQAWRGNDRKEGLS